MPALRASLRAVRRSHARFFIATAFALVVVACLTFIVYNVPLLLFMISAWNALATFTWVMRPPCVIVLASSTSHTARGLARSIARCALGHRVMYFFSPERYPSPDVPYHLWMGNVMDNYHMVSDEKWDEVVMPLIDLVPVIVVDARQISSGLEFELQRINACEALVSKAVVIAQGAERMRLEAFNRLGRRIVKSEHIESTGVSNTVAKLIMLTLAVHKASSGTAWKGAQD